MKRLVVALLLAAAFHAGNAYAYQINATGGNPLTFGVGSTSATATEKLRITSAGLVGIGTATPTAPLSVSGTISATAFVGDGSLLTNVPAGATNLSETIAINDLKDAIVSTSTASMFLGSNVGGLANGSGLANVAIGPYAFASNTSGAFNTALGMSALAANVTNNNNTAIGGSALSKSTGSRNTGVGSSALYSTTAGNDNTGFGYQVLNGNTTGTGNVAAGNYALLTNTTGTNNVSIGYQSLYYPAQVTGTVAIGYNAGQGNGSTGYSYGTYVGTSAGYSITTGGNNTLLGAYAGDSITTGTGNLAIGYDVDTPAPGVSYYLNIGNAISGSLASGGSLTFIGGIKANGVVTATYFEGDGSRLTNIAGGSGGDRITSNTSYAIAQTGGTVLVSGSMYINNGVSASDAALRIGANPTGNHYSYIDMAGDTTYTGYGLRIIRYNTGANASSQIFHRGTGDFALVTQEAAALTFDTTNTERMRIADTGLVGIGTAAPTDILNVVTTTNGSRGLLVTNLSSGTTAYTRTVLTNDAANVAGMLFNSSLNTAGYAGANGLAVGTFSTGPLALYTANAPRMTITSAGNVGIGTTAPSNSLNISTSTVGDGINIMSPNSTSVGLSVSNSVGQGTLSISGGTNNYANGVTAGDTVLRSLQYGTNTGNLVIAALTTSGSITFRTGALASDVERMRINSSGYIGMGTSNPTSTLHISSTGPYGVIIEGSTSAGIGQPRLNLIDTAAGTVTTQPAWVIDNSLDSFRIFRQPTVSTAGQVALRIVSSTKVAIGTATAPNVALDVSGAIVSRVANVGAATSFDWAQSNSQYTTATCGAFTMSNMQDGGTYSLLVSSTTAGTCSFTHTVPTTLTFKLPAGHGATTSGKTTLYGFTRFGTNVYTTWQPGY